MTVLIVDDESAVRDFARTLLETSGYSVVDADSGTAALERVQRGMPDCIVLDLVMPELSGFDTLRTLRKDHKALPPVVILTSMDGGGTRTYATKVNKADAFVTKADLEHPVNGLVAQVRRLTRA